MALQEVFNRVRKASRKLNMLSDDKVRKVLLDLADGAEAEADAILAANEQD